MRLALYVLGRLASRTLAGFLVLATGFALLAVLDFARREPRLGGFAALELAPTLAIYASGSLLLAALAAGAAATFASLAQDGELTAAANAGVGAPRWIACLGALAAACVPWCFHHQTVVLPRARAARGIELRALLRSPDACARWIEAEPSLAPGLVIDVARAQGGEFSNLRALELGPDDLPRAAWWAERARVRSPEARDVLEIELEHVMQLRGEPGGGVERLEAREMRLAFPLAELARRKPADLRSRIGATSTRELGRIARATPASEEGRRARAERSSRFALAAAPFAAAFGGAALGLWLASAGSALASLAGLCFFGGIYLPLHASATRWIVAGASGWWRLAAEVAVAALGLYAIARWRGR